MRGTVKWFNDSKGYGFITVDGLTLPNGDVDLAKRDIFVHYRSIIKEGFKTLAEGQEVELEVNYSPKGLVAVDVRPISRLERMGITNDLVADAAEAIDVIGEDELESSAEDGEEA